MQRASKPRDLVGDIHRKQRQKLFRRAALVVALMVMLLMIGVALKLFADRRARNQVLDEARQAFARGTAADLAEAGAILDGGLREHEADPDLLAGLALTRAQQLAEFGENPEAAKSSVADLPEDAMGHDAQLARGMLALNTGDLETARAALEAVRGMDDGQSLSPNHEIWLAGMLAIADPDADLDAAIAELDAALEGDASMSTRRLLAALHMHAGNGDTALELLTKAREQSRTHMGLAADEALYNALLRQKLGGVADVADQLLGTTFEISSRDRAHALLARGVVHVHSGELEKGMERVAEAWVLLPGWDKPSRSLALEVAMEAGDTQQARAWTQEAGLTGQEAAIYEAWADFVEGDVMGSLASLAELEQTHPRVALLQGLALVEQRRFEEAKPWLDRADGLLPGRVDVEVARARVEVFTGDPSVALRKLEALAEEEPHAPRAWTGLGEAHRTAGRDADSGKASKAANKDARRAFRKATEREMLPAEAHLQLGELADERRSEEPDAAIDALQQFERAAEVNPRLPRYPERLAAYLATLGYEKRAYELYREIFDRPGVEPHTMVRAVQLAVRLSNSKEIEKPKDLETWIDEAEKAGADSRDIDRERARLIIEEGDKAQFPKAREILDQLLTEEPGDVDARILLSRAIGGIVDREAAMTAIRRGFQYVDDSEHGALHLEWANLEFRSGSRRRAAARARAGWNRIKSSHRAPAELMEAAAITTRMFLRDKKGKPALTVARELTDAVPFHSEAWTIRAGVQLKAADASDARASAEKAIELDPDNPRAHELLGHTLLRFGNKDRAREAYERAVELTAGTPMASDFKENLDRL